MPGSKRRLLFLMGEPASGKSTIARRLFAAMGGLEACPETDPLYAVGGNLRRASDAVWGHFGERHRLWMLGRYGQRRFPDDDVRLVSTSIPEYSLRATRRHVLKYGLPVGPDGVRLKLDEEVYEGVDRLSRSCQPNAERVVRECTAANLFVEGDRLTRVSFFRAMLEQRDRGALVSLVYLRVRPEVLEARRAARRDDMGEEFLAPLRTRYLNIRAELGADVTTMDCDTRAQGAAVWRHVAKHLGVKV